MDDSERKILRVRWSYSNDFLVFDLSALAFHASKLDPTKRGIVGVASIEFMPCRLYVPSNNLFQFYFKSCVKLSLTGMSHFHQNKVESFSL